MSKPNNFHRSGQEAPKTDAAGNPIVPVDIDNIEAAAAMGYGPSKKKASGTGATGTGVSDELVKLPLLKQISDDSLLRYDIKIPLYNTFIYARQVSPQDLAELRAANRRIEVEGKPLKREKARLEREYAELEQQDFATSEEFDARDARLDEIDARLAEILERAEVLTASEKGLISDLVKKHAVAASWTEGGREVFTREVQFSAIGDEIEIGQIIVAYSQAGNTVLDALKGR